MEMKHIFDVSIQYAMNSMNMNMVYSSIVVNGGSRPRSYEGTFPSIELIQSSCFSWWLDIWLV